MNFKKSLVLAALVAAFSINQSNANSYSYNFVENDGSSGVTGTITLDSAASNNGSLADILGISFYDANAPYSFTFDPTVESLFLNSAAFTWTSAGITEMNIGVIPNGSSYFYQGVYDNGIWYGGLDEAIGGVWVAANASTVPDTANTFVLSALALAGLIFLSRTMKWRPLAAGK